MIMEKFPHIHKYYFPLPCNSTLKNKTEHVYELAASVTKNF